MGKKSYSSILKEHQYVKLYSKKAMTAINASSSCMIVMPKDISSSRIVVYEKKACNGMITMTCFIRLTSLQNGMSIKHMSFKMHKRIESDDKKFKKAVVNMLNEQMDLEEALEDEYGFAKV